MKEHVKTNSRLRIKPMAIQKCKGYGLSHTKWVHPEAQPLTKRSVNSCI